MMISSSVTYLAANRQAGGVCTGTLWRIVASTAARNSSSSSNRKPGAQQQQQYHYYYAPSAAAAADQRSAVPVYAVLVASCLHTYESELHYRRGDPPVHTWYVVGASAWSKAPHHQNQQNHKTAFRLVTNRGTHVYCWTATEHDRDAWLSALQAGLELSLSHPELVVTPGTGPLFSAPPEPPASAKSATPAARSSFLFGNRSQNQPGRYCKACGCTTAATTTADASSAEHSTAAANATLTVVAAAVAAAVRPVQQYGFEDRQDLCASCATAQGVVQHLHHLQCVQAAVGAEIGTVQQAREACRAIAVAAAATAGTAVTAPSGGAAAAAEEDAEHSSSNSNSSAGAAKCGEEQGTERSVAAAAAAAVVVTGDPHHSPNNNDNNNSTSESWSQVDGSGNGDGNCSISEENSGNSSSAGSTQESGNSGALSSSVSWHKVAEPGQQEERAAAAAAASWVTVPPTPAATRALSDFLQTAQFAAWARQCSALSALQRDFLGGHIGAADFLELLDEAAGVESTETVAASLKKQAFRVAGDMGTAMKLLLEQALPANESTSNTKVLQCVLEFLLDLCDDGEISSVAFFWPQLCHIHLRMLPPVNALSVARVELMEDFLLTVATRYSIHLALELVWSHTADLEESLQVSPSASDKSSKSGTTGAKDPTVEASAVSPACRRRRFAVLRFVCELESLLFDFEGGWGGGSVSLGKMLAPTAHQAELMKQASKHIQELRMGSDELTGPDGRVYSKQQNRLTRSARFDMLSSSRKNKPPEEQAQEKLRIAKNADYFSCHINFSKRLADIAEKLRFMDLADRAHFLEEELNLLNSSGTMGGDPLNRIREHLIRVVRVPSTEGHVFRSKERTPVLLLMEIVDEMAEAQLPLATDKGECPSRDEEAEPPAASCDGPASASETVRDQTAATATKTADEHQPDLSQAKGEGEDVQKSKDANGPRSQLQKAQSPPPPLLEGALEGFRQSPGAKALKRFGSDGEPIETPAPTTPKRDVQQIVNTVALEQLKEIIIPDLGQAPDIMSEEGKEASYDDSAVDEVPGEQAVQRSSSAGSSAGRGASRRPSSRTEPDETGRTARKMSTLGSLKGTRNDVIDSTNTLAPTGDIRRAVLTTIMMRGLQGNTIAAGAADSVQRSLKELERRRATELLLSDDNDAAPTESNQDNSETEIDTTRQKLLALGLIPCLEEAELASRPTEEDEVMEAIRLMLIQNQVAQGHLSPADAAKVLQHTSLSPINASKQSVSFDGTETVDLSDHPTIDAGDVDPRLVGCGPLPPAVLQAMTLWKGGMVTHAELLELVKKDIEFVKHSILVDAENLDMLKENSAFWGRFAFGERWAEKKSRIGSSSPQGSLPGWDMIGIIVKSNDDLRQEAFVMQLIELCQEAFELAELELWISPYRIVATGRTTGVIECVRNAMSFDALKKRPGYGKGGLREHLQRMTEFTADPGGSFKSAQQNFVRSLAAYSLLSYFFLFKDRHNGNLLLDTAGHVIHIDFGFVFGVAPGGSFSLEMSTPFKLTEEMLDVMGGLRSPLFSEFVTLFCCGFLALQSHCDTFLTLVEITSRESTFKCFEGRDTEEVVSKLRERFSPDLSKEDTVSFALDLIKQATTSYGTRQYDIYQYLSQGIVA